VNPWQLAQQIKHKLQTVTWATGSAQAVFGTRSVFVYGGAPQDEEIHPGFPFALVTMDAGTPDTDHPDLIEQQFTVVTCVEVAGDPMGEFAIIGSSRTDAGSSAGAGIAEVAERVRSAVQSLTGIDGASMVVSGQGVTAPQQIGNGRHVVYDSFGVTAMCSSQPWYAEPQQLNRNALVLSWSGAHCSSRFDFLRYKLTYRAGSTPHQAPDVATTLYTGTATSYTATSVPAGIYTCFAEYDARRTGTATVASDGRLVGSYLVV
jgi:hypothetical protein